MILFEKIIGKLFMFRKRNLFILVPLLIILFVTYLRFKEIPYDDYKALTLQEMQEHNDKLERITKSFATNNNIPKEYEKKLYDCAGDYIYTKDAAHTFETVMQECKNEYKSGEELTHYNQSWLMKDFNKYDGNYGPLQKIIQKTIKDPKTYQMLETRYELHFDDARPHMFVSIDFKALNMYGYMLTRNMSARVDARTKEIYDLK